MPIFVSLGNATQKGKEAIREVGKRFEDLKRVIQEANGKVLAAYSLLGRYDYLLITEFPSEQEATRVLTRIASRGMVSSETLIALPLGEFIRIAQEA